jgi:hypothetical protein
MDLENGIFVAKGVFCIYLYFCSFRILPTHIQPLSVDPSLLGCFGDQEARKKNVKLRQGKLQKPGENSIRKTPKTFDVHETT